MGDTAGQIFVFFIMAVAAAEAAIGLAIVLSLYRNQQTVYVDKVNLMKW
jgi:NADH-quinone oxidoreductase subunit K